MSNVKPGLYFSLHGIDGSGKTTVAYGLQRYITEELGERAINVREPGGTVEAELLRDLYKGNNFTPLALYHLMAAARAELIAKVVKPALAAGTHVITDRNFLCSVAYQGIDLGFEWLMDQMDHQLYADTSILLDVSLSAATNRRASRGEDEDTFDYGQVADHYSTLVHRDAIDYSVPTSNSTLTQVQTQCNAIVNKSIKERRLMAMFQPLGDHERPL